ncbi:hypothetical protein GYMLUDRAFT_79626 [Collybiopsis luxurians FD-317 M1]|nr:hypothetical protein GYMLUDRAFT_79626 [Collybiopsis luxurians FD-317 M1]
MLLTFAYATFSSLSSAVLVAAAPLATNGGGIKLDAHLPTSDTFVPFPVGTLSGVARPYAPGVGACGFTNTDADFVVAISALIFDNYPGYNGTDPTLNPSCGQEMTITFQGKSTTATAVDRCSACAFADLDLTPALFEFFADISLGAIDVQWQWVSQ